MRRLRDILHSADDGVLVGIQMLLLAAAGNSLDLTLSEVTAHKFDALPTD